jgi:hypothetical protein
MLTAAQRRAVLVQQHTMGARSFCETLRELVTKGLGVGR